MDAYRALRTMLLELPSTDPHPCFALMSPELFDQIPACEFDTETHMLIACRVSETEAWVGDCPVFPQAGAGITLRCAPVFSPDIPGSGIIQTNLQMVQP